MEVRSASDVAANCNQVHEMKPIYDALGKKMENPI